MRFTIDRSLTDTKDVELEVIAGATLAQVLDGVTRKRAWCGATLLDPSHPAGLRPLLQGARLRDGPGAPTSPLEGLHLAAIAGPDAGAVIEVDGQVTIGSAPGRHRLDDDAVDACHVMVERGARGSLLCLDQSSTNGTGWWRWDGQGWSWRGHRRRITAREGDVLTVGCTALQVRSGSSSPAPDSLWAPSRRLTRWLSRLPWVPTPAWDGLPDPTTVGDWSGPAILSGPRAQAAARALVLARGRRPPAPMPLDEQWLSWLPEALPGDGPITCEPDGPPRPETTFEAHATMSTLADATTRQARLPLGVSAVRADALARAVASTAPAPWPTSVRWADLAHRDAPRAIDGALTATLGVVCDETLEPWRIRFDDDAPHLLVAGAHGSGTSTLLATLVAGLCAHHHPSQLSVVLIGAGTGSPLSACARLPHVKRIVADVGGAEAAAALEAVAASALRRRDTRGTAGDAGDAGDASWTDTTSLDTVPTKLLVVVDDFDEITGRSRSAALALDRLAGLAPSVGVHLAMATHRPAGAITPTLRAACAHAVALRTTTASDSMGLVGVPDAASPGQPAGRGIARSAGKRAVVQVALPAADPSPLVRRLDRADAVPRHLAEVLIADARQETWAASDAP